MSKFKTLYKKTSTGAIQLWSIEARGTSIITIHGQVDGKLQTTEDIVKVGKNLGKANATTAEEQAQLEAEARHTKQLKKGYVDTEAKAAKGATDKVIEGGQLPMLAKSFDDQGHKILWPAAVQPKLDGHRCIAVFDEAGKVSLWTRTRKPITSVPHIIAALEKTGAGNCVLDGELYNHELKADFERLTSLIRQEEPHPDAHDVEYHVYDCMAADIDFADRIQLVKEILGKKSASLKCVETVNVANEAELISCHDNFVERGYEGAMVRNLASPYEGKRSSHLQKVKDFKDAEFKVVRLEEGRGKLMGHAGTCICELADGREFGVKMSGDTAELKKAWEKPTMWVGKMLTVKFQNYTSGGMPRFPVGMRIRKDL